MTRAKEVAYIVSQNGHQSEFFIELFPRNFGISNTIQMTCPVCGGTMVLKTNKNGHKFYGCSNYRSKGCKFTRDYELDRFQPHKKI
ncbi:Topoisomerase DNA binding C4 zinc finger [Thermoplasmatales archaeon BRNA1]|nr:Topoisomerase DNA binding C4 zinc finger [Thermoplasmatales archaeon BRNA1]